ncbi:pantoate--beta-alanine ligase [Albimonas donghaensis]|uniref:pantoate--beta-alanine ligase (AMP-forming) n=1 Tax=Albimonas donghaensis TaxID=356660 RepID=A0A1H2YAB1_9RHOB|nr:pantoate--beta-alanine ligase [Albimonas donghaensis]SDX01905.1 pantoate--beta-alanine ligase [Albimonas donghaensis]
MHNLPLLRSTSQLRSRIRSWRAFGETVALVPTGAGLHEGHAAVIRAARAEADRVLVAAADWWGEPAALTDAAAIEALCDRADEAGADAVYIPSQAALRPEGARTRLVTGAMGDVMCGEDRPGMFAAYALAGVRMLSHAQADFAFYSEREWQRLAIMRQVSADLAQPTEVRAAPTERDMDGVALCEEAEALTGADRDCALRLWREISRAASSIEAGGAPDPALDDAADRLADAGAEVEYLDLRDAATLEEVETWNAERPARVFVAIRLGEARLVDNVAVGGGSDTTVL